MYCTFPLVRSLFFGSCLLSISSPKNITRKPSLTLPLFIKVSVSSQESEQSCICGLSSGILGLLLFWFFLFGGGGGGGNVMVFNATFNNISVISCDRFYWWRKPKKTDKLYRCIEYISPERDSSSQR